MTDFYRDFVFEGVKHPVKIIWINDEPLFEANNMAKILGIRNIRSSIMNFDSNEKVVHKMDPWWKTRNEYS